MTPVELERLDRLVRGLTGWFQGQGVDPADAALVMQMLLASIILDAAERGGGDPAAGVAALARDLRKLVGKEAGPVH